MMMNLKKFNNFVHYKHITLEYINYVINLIKPNVYGIYWPKRCILFSTYLQWSSKIS